MHSNVQIALELLDLHHQSFYTVEPFASKTGHPVPMDTRGWSQILASILTGIPGLERQKGADLKDGSDVKAANTWKAIDTPRFNGVIKAGTKSDTSGRLESLDVMPHLYLVLWDESPRQSARCRIWVVRAQEDHVFRTMCESWYKQRQAGKIVSNNFQLHPPRGLDTNVIRNTCGNLEYPLYFSAERKAKKFVLVEFKPEARTALHCRKVER
jgi:hypothetical protein